MKSDCTQYGTALVTLLDQFLKTNYCFPEDTDGTMAKIRLTDAPAKKDTLKNCTNATKPDTRAKMDRTRTQNDDRACRSTVGSTDATALDVKAKLLISINCHDEDAGYLWSATQKPPLVPQKKNDQRSNETAQDSSAKILMNHNTGSLRNPQKYDAALPTTFDAKTKWKFITLQTMELPFFTQCAPPWTSKVDDGIPTASRVPPMSLTECTNRCNVTGP